MKDWEQRLAQRTIAVAVAAGELIEVTDPVTGEMYYAPACRYFTETDEPSRRMPTAPAPESETGATRGRHAAPRPHRFRAGPVASFIAGIIAIPSLAAAASNWLNKPSATNSRVEVESDQAAVEMPDLEEPLRLKGRREERTSVAPLSVRPENWRRIDPDVKSRLVEGVSPSSLSAETARQVRRNAVRWHMTGNSLAAEVAAKEIMSAAN